MDTNSASAPFSLRRTQRPEDVVALAQLTEQVGLEYATFQDHPYQSAFLDTWTLLTWVASQTTTLRVAPNVLNLPLRQPAVLARSAASLDLLSGGRLELGLGAGAFWDPIVAMGGSKLTPGQAVDALSEAIDVIRQLWDTSTRRGVRVEGEHYRVVGAKRGPEPAHDIGLWLGAYKPRMLRLTGRKADGWLPSLAYLPLEDIAPANAAIDEAARKAGRDPREIRRLLNIGDARRSSSCCRSRSSTASAPSSSPATTRARSSASASRSRPPCARRWRKRAPTPARPSGRWSAAQKRWRRGVTGIDYDVGPGGAARARGRAGRQGLREGPLDLHAHRARPGSCCARATSRR